MAHYDHIIIGRGLAGTLLSYELIGRGRKILVIDANGEGASTAVAAGMFNPMVFKRLVKAWMVDELLPVAKKTFDEIAEGSWNTTGLVKLFTTEKDELDWRERALEGGYTDHLQIAAEPLVDKSELIKPFGYGTVPKAGRVDLQAMLVAGREFLLSQDALLEERILYEDIKFDEETVKVGAHSADNIIFCEGHQVVNNPWFQYLPFKLAKGEVLTVRMPDLELDKTINRGHFILPLGNNIYKVGSTFDWKELDDKPTEKGKQWIMERLRRAYSGPVEILDHQAGIRPTVSDRRPIMGRHHELEHAYIFNGLGARGAMIAPYFVKHFADHLLNGKELIAEVDIQRFPRKA